MRRRREDAFCGGGGGMWMETDSETRINQHRLDDVLADQVDVVATACPYCLLMLDDAIRSQGTGESVQAMGVSDIIAARCLGDVR